MQFNEIIILWKKGKKDSAVHKHTEQELFMFLH